MKTSDDLFGSIGSGEEYGAEPEEKAPEPGATEAGKPTGALVPGPPMLSAFLRPQVCELGKIKIGGKGPERKSQSGSTYRIPMKLDHFVVTTLNRAPNGDLIPDVKLMENLVRLHGDPDGHVRQIPVSLLSNKIEEVLQTAAVWYDGKKVGARCEDGKVLTIYTDPKSMERLKEPRLVEWKPEFLALKKNKAPMFKLHTILSCVIAAEDSKWGGVYRFRTTSRISAEQLYGSLAHLQSLTRGVIRGLPLRLVVRPMIVTPEGTVTTVYVVHVELRGSDLHHIQQLALEERRQETKYITEISEVEREYQRLLVAPGASDEPEAETADVGGEFHPEAQTGEASNDDVTDAEIEGAPKRMDDPAFGGTE